MLAQPERGIKAKPDRCVVDVYTAAEEEEDCLIASDLLLRVTLLEHHSASFSEFRPSLPLGSSVPVFGFGVTIGPCL
jgi:hypothetical protein